MPSWSGALYRFGDLNYLVAHGGVSSSPPRPLFSLGAPFTGARLPNQFGAGSPYRLDSPTNPYGSGWRIEGR